uniref:UDP-N-acetylglucosamine 1-carboxyvinyltransferase n=1 Tax=candidate division WOR-3 bacterium TaxID=2052148 RepID=A0A7V3NUH9_UNCW3
MKYFRVYGPAYLEGEVQVQGAKNAVLPIMSAIMLHDQPVLLKNVPRVQDVFTMIELLKLLGAKVEWKGNNELQVDPTTINSYTAPYEIVSKMRASIYVLGPLLVKFGRAEVSFPGGCSFGPRPVDFHIKGLSLLGAELTIERGYIKATMKKPNPCEIPLDFKSVGTTIHLMTTAAMMEGETTILNSAQEPEVVATAEFLAKSGVKIEGAGTDVIKIKGTKKLKPVPEFEIIPDRIEAGTYLVAGFMTGGKVKVTGCIPEHLEPVILKLKEAGALINRGKDFLEVEKRTKEISSLHIETQPFPGFPTDMQPQFMSMLTVAKGTSIIKEGIYPNRFAHAFELQRLGANIKVVEPTAFVEGVNKLTGAEVTGNDLRGAAALVLAGLIAEGETTVFGIEHLERGYENFREKLISLGAKIEVS